MIKEPIFQLQEYFFPALFFMENSQYDKKKHAEPELKVAAKILPCKGKKNLWRVLLEVSTPKNMDQTTFPYEFSAFVIGTIKATPMLKGEDPLIVKKLLYVNGVSVLYSAARERLSLFFNVRNFPYYTLPTHRFDPDDITE